jgi:hypothetical protein
MPHQNLKREGFHRHFSHLIPNGQSQNVTITSIDESFEPQLQHQQRPQLM